MWGSILLNKVANTTTLGAMLLGKRFKKYERFDGLVSWQVGVKSQRGAGAKRRWVSGFVASLEQAQATRRLAF
ncbi:hypothetical protein DK37_28605 [Halomonas sp. SUBG004]|nr:hypothetical protein DK37_28605 [Halomonas sp. SUBG004]